ncbi:tRNA (adenosine(37)-N6)-dimethylallyltransferase MiaA [Paenibacillus aurantius]|uniref:tRNA dimethylallyltransferase n=1 Tax=Paenibacillus aurantius TaxID=2918900 RepID=A0AA96L9T7_9BACL|nr:tRNA (adenosine(37)-N6)-dimethylallyltransferase MiaA [Paenibacillus aurantius]WNQ09169.1 tRNA (adenosine(37)-N6)-dimethylallyltransferase MiaA [Paenibacillus aurantius]
MERHLENKPELLVLIGPTAVGKTKLSIALARAHGCEIISGDSMQVYRGMDIGTAKITPEEQQGVPHHLIDILNPDEPFSAADFQERAGQAIRDIRSRNRLPFVVGGTGLYIESLCYQYRFSEGGADEAFREEQMRYLQDYGPEALHDRLREVDPPSADRLHPNDYRRVIRALEIHHVTGATLSEQLAGQNKESPYRLCLIGLTMDRALLYKRIEERIDEMLEKGLLREVQGLLERGCSPDLISMQALGYKEMVGYLRGDYSYEHAVYLLKRDTRRFAKRQLSWFRHMKDIHWVDVTDTVNFAGHLQTINAIIATKYTESEA